MARIAGVNIPDDKHAVVSLTYIYGVGRSTARKLCDAAGIDHAARVGDLSEEQLEALRGEIGRISVEGDRKSTRLNSSHVASSYAVSCLKQKTPRHAPPRAARPRDQTR